MGNGSIFLDYRGSGKAKIGASTFATGNHFSGNIHDLRVWSKTRTLSQWSVQKSQILSGSELGLMFNWRMDEADGNIAKEHVRRRDADILGADWQISPNGNAVSFNGTNHLKIASGDVNITDNMDMTLEFWFNSTQADAATLFSNGRGDGMASDSLFSWNIDKDADGKIHIKHYGIDFIATNNNYFDGEWHHFALVLQRTGNLTAYVDGNFQNSIDASIFKQLGGSHMYLGTRGYRIGVTEVFENYFEGKIDEFRLWNTARKFEQIQRDKQNRMRADELALKMYLPFENYQLDPTGVALLTASFNEQIDSTNHTVKNTGIVELIDDTPLIKLQRPIQQVAFDYSVNGDEIIFTTTTLPESIEEVTLDITVSGVKDLHGNTMESPETWIAFVRKNQVLWEDDLLEFEKMVGEELSFSSAMLNRGGEVKTFDIIDIPDWMSVTPSSGIIPPNSTLQVDFEIDPQVNIGSYFEDIKLLTDFGYPENLTINLKVNAEAPDWTIDPAAYQYSMGIIGMIRVQNVASTDIEDKLAAFVGGELRGVQNVQYLPQSDAYLVFMDVYGNGGLETLNFQIFDASTGNLYSDVEPRTMDFQPNSLVGSLATPQEFAAGAEISFDIPLNPGWNWIGHFLQNEDSTNLDVILESLNSQAGDVIKGETAYANYSPVNGWQGNLESEGIRPENLYKLKVQEADILSIKGEIIYPTSRQINIVNGWNRIGFISVRNQPTSEAMGNLEAAQGDLIKGQSQFAVYDTQLGWIGSLQTLTPGRGYMYQSVGNKSFRYPIAGYYKLDNVVFDEFEHPNWTVDYNVAPSNMTAIIRLENDCQDVILANHYAVGSFNSAGKLQGISPIIQQENDLLTYLTTIGEDSETLKLRLLDLDRLMEYDLATPITYTSNSHLDNIEINLDEKLCRTLAEQDLNNKVLRAYPSIFEDKITVEFLANQVDENANITLHNTLGQIVFRQKVALDTGANIFQLNLAEEKLSAGVYILTLTTHDTQVSVKLIKE